MLDSIIQFFFGSKEENEIVDSIIKSWKENPNEWSVDDYYVRRGEVRIWIANAKYGDMQMNDRRLPQRSRLRKELYLLKMTQASSSLNH